MRYRYRAYEKDKRIKGTVEAANIEEAKRKLSHLVILDIKPTRKLSLHFGKKVPKRELAKLFNTLGHYLRASLPLPKALTLTKNQLENGRLIAFLDHLLAQIKEGQSLSHALETQNILRLPPYIVNSAKIGEESGKLDVVFIELAKFLQEEDAIAKKTVQALIYPLFIVAISLFMIAFMLTNVVPKIVQVFSGLRQDLPPITQFVVASGNFLQNHIFQIVVFFTISIAFFLLLYAKSSAMQLFVDTMLLKLPIVKKIILSKELGRFSYLTSVLVRSGINYLNAITLATATIENEAIKHYFQKALQEVIEGKKFSHALHKAGFSYDKSFIQALALAEETGEIEEILRNISAIYFEENSTRIETLLRLLEPSLIILVGGAIGFIVTALLLPMFRMNILH